MKFVKTLFPFYVFYVLVFVSLCQADTKRAEPPKNSAPKIEYNYVKDITYIDAEIIRLTGDPSFLGVRASYSYEGKIPRKPKEIFLSFIENHADISWPDGTKLYIRYGDKKFSYDTLISRQYSHGLWIEIVMVFVPTTDFLDICQSDAFYFQIAQTSDVINGEYFAPFRELARTIPTAPEAK
jgi:hypothetical protein